MLPQQDSEALNRHYATTDAWRIRVKTHEKYTYPKINFVEWVMKLTSWKGDESVLDVGCGTGKYHAYIKKHLPGVTYVGVDYSFAMLDSHDGDNLARANMASLPFPDGTFDVVMANHVIYFAPDIDATLRELRRVLKPGGIFIAATSSNQTMPQFRELFRRAILLVSPPGVSRDVRVPETLHRRFALENGSVQLARHYHAVVRHDLPGAFVFSSVEPIMEYLESTRDIREKQLPDGVSWDQVMMIMREQLSNLIQSLQTLMVDKLTGVLVATDNGGFIEEYMAIKEKTSDKTPSTG